MIATLGNVCNFLNGGTPSKAVSSYFEGDIPWITSADIVGPIANVARSFITEDAVKKSATNKVATGTVLLVTRTGVGKVAIAGRDLCFSQDITALIPDSAKLDGGYLVQYLRTKQSYFVRHARGATIKGITRDVVADLSIPLPPIPEQIRIAAILDQADALRFKRVETLAQLDSLTQAIFIEMFGDPATNPKKFPKRKLGEIIKFEGGSQPPASTFTNEETPETIRLIQIRDFKTDKFKTFIPRSLSRRFFKKDDVMIGRYGPPVFQILRGLSGSYNVALMKAVPRDGIMKEFVFHLLQEQRLHNFVVLNSERTAGQSGVNLELLEKYDAYHPPIELQQEFMRRVSMINRFKTAMRDSQDQMNALFATLQHRAFRGEL